MSSCENQANGHQVLLDTRYTALFLREPVMENIFRYLNSNQLKKCSIVCTTWNSTISDVLRRRQEPLYLQGNLGQTSAATLVDKIMTVVRKAYSDLFCGVIFCFNLKLELVMTLERELPIRNALCLNLYNSVNCGARISALIFPKYIKGVDIYFFHALEEVEKAHFKREMVPDITKIPADKSIKCLIILKSAFQQQRVLYEDVALEIQNYYTDKENGSLAVGGSVVWNTKFSHFVNGENVFGAKRNSLVGLAFGGELFDAASIFLNQKKKKEEILEELLAFRNGFVLRKVSYAIMFTSTKLFETSNDTTSFTECYGEIFPEVPLLGMKNEDIGNSTDVIGTTYIPGAASKKRTLSQPFVNEIVLVILTWNIG